MRAKIFIPIVLVCATIASFVVIRQMQIAVPDANKNDMEGRSSIVRWRKSMPAVSPIAPQASASLIALGATSSAGVFQQLVGMWADPPPAMIGLGGSIHATSPGIVYYYEIE